jgi:hypothetical protein
MQRKKRLLIDTLCQEEISVWGKPEPVRLAVTGCLRTTMTQFAQTVL